MTMVGGVRRARAVREMTGAENTLWLSKTAIDRHRFIEHRHSGARREGGASPESILTERHLAR
jgi:hypothetical protein